MSNLSAARNQNLWFGYNAPFIGGNEGVVSRQVDEKLIKNDLLQLLLTSPGDRVMRPSFGTGIRKFVFELITTETIETLRQSIQDAVDTYEPRVTVSSIDIDTSNQDNNVVQIKLFGYFNLDKYNTNPNNAQLLVELKVPLNQLGQATTQVARS